MHAHICINDTKTEFFVLGQHREYRCKLVLCFPFSFASMAMGYIGYFKQGYSSSGIIVSLFQMVFQKKFVSFVWYKRDKLRFTIVLEYYWSKCRFPTHLNVCVFLLKRLPFFLSTHPHVMACFQEGTLLFPRQCSFQVHSMIHLLFFPFY